MKIISLTTDFGIADYFVADLKASILSQYADVQFVDVSHQIASHDIMQAAYYVQNVQNSFPVGTIHIVAVYNYYEPKSKFVAFERDGQYYLGPNNGVFSLVFNDIDPKTVREIDFGDDISLTNIFSNAVALISNGIPLNDIGPMIDEFHTKLPISPVITQSQIRATVLHIDHYNNAIINITKPQFEKIRNGRKFEIYYKQTDPIRQICKHYGEVAVGEVLALFDSTGYLVIAINMDRASDQLNLIKNETIQINFYD